MAEPVGNSWNEAAILHNVLLPNETNRNLPPVTVRNARPEEPLRHEDPFGMMSQSSVPKIGKLALRLVEP